MPRNLIITAFVCFNAITCICSTARADNGTFALQFDGVDDYLQIEPTNALPPTGNASVTIEAWINVALFNPKGAMVLGWGPEGLRQTHFLMLSVGYVHFSHWGADYSYAADVQMGVWYHVAAVHDGSANMDIVYLNGTPLGSNSPPSLNVVSTRIVIGRHCNVSDYFFAGMLDEVRIWNVVRSGDQIRAAMRKTLASPQPGLVARWGFDEGSGSTAADTSGTGANAVLFNQPTWVAHSLGPSPPTVTIEVSEVRLCWSSETNTMYQVQYRSDLTTNAWVNLAEPIPGNGTTNCVTDAVVSPRRFYRVLALP